MMKPWFAGASATGCGSSLASRSASASWLFVAPKNASMKPTSINFEDSSASTSMWWLSPPSGEAIMKNSFEGKPSSAPYSIPDLLTPITTAGSMTAALFACGIATPSSNPVLPNSSRAFISARNCSWSEIRPWACRTATSSLNTSSFEVA